jgi:hypothetical protein
MNRWILRLPWLAAAAFVVAAYCWMRSDPRIPKEAFRDYSIYNTSPEGVSLAYGYLGSTGHDVRPLAHSLDKALLPDNAVLLRLRPEPPADFSEVDAGRSVHLKPEHAWDQKEASTYAFTAEEEDWVRRGGRLVIAIDRSYGSVGVRSLASPPPAKVYPLWPDVERLAPPSPRILTGPTARECVTLFASGEGAVLGRQSRGKGDVLLCSVPEIFQNRSLGSADHLALLARLASTGRPVYFDEYVHGVASGTGALEVLRSWGFGPFLGVWMIAAGVSFWRRRVRLGPEEDDHRETRVEAVDLVDSLSVLYRRMLPRAQAVRLYEQEFVNAVAIQTGLRHEALQARARQLLAADGVEPPGDRNLSQRGFQRQLDRINFAFRRLKDEKRPGSRQAAPAGARST